MRRLAERDASGDRWIRGKGSGCRTSSTVIAGPPLGRPNRRATVGAAEPPGRRWAWPRDHLAIVPIATTAPSTGDGSGTKEERGMGKFAKPARNVRMVRDPEDAQLAVALA